MTSTLHSPNTTHLPSTHPTPHIYPPLTQHHTSTLHSPNTTHLPSTQPTPHIYPPLTQHYMTSTLHSPNTTHLPSTHPTPHIYPPLTQHHTSTLHSPNTTHLPSTQPTPHIYPPLIQHHMTSTCHSPNTTWYLSINIIPQYDIILPTWYLAVIPDKCSEWAVWGDSHWRHVKHCVSVTWLGPTHRRQLSDIIIMMWLMSSARCHHSRLSIICDHGNRFICRCIRCHGNRMYGSTSSVDSGLLVVDKRCLRRPRIGLFPSNVGSTAFAQRNLRLHRVHYDQLSL